MSTKRQVHVLIVSAAFQGHLNPSLTFAKRLASKGLHVTVATTEEARHRLLKSNAFVPNPNAETNIKLEFFSDGLSINFDRQKNAASFMSSLETNGSRNLSDLITELGKNRRFSCIIVTPFVPWAIEVASTHGIPCAMLWFQACALYSIYYRFARNINPFPDFENPDEIVELPGFPLLKVGDLPTFLLPSCPQYHKKLVWDFPKNLNKVEWVLGASVYEIEQEIVNSMAELIPIHPIGPLVSPFLLGEKESTTFSVDLWNPEDSCLEWLDNKPDSSVIYVAFGSLMVLSQKQMDNIAMALKNSKRLFLWVIRPMEECSEQKGAKLPNGFLEETKGRGLVVNWCPQEKVLMHPAVACFVSHCGWSSTLEAVAAGVPIIGYPNWSDQPTNAKLVEDVFMNGLRLRFKEDGIFSTQEVERCITEVMEGPKAAEIRKRAMKLKAAAQRALADGGSSDRNINRFVEGIVERSS